MWNKDDVTVCCIDELVLNWEEPISHLYYDQGTDVEMVAFKLLDLINNNTGSYWELNMFVRNRLRRQRIGTMLYKAATEQYSFLFHGLGSATQEVAVYTGVDGSEKFWQYMGMEVG